MKKYKDGELAANVFDIQKFSVHDGPGIRTIIFTKGCPLSCQWCANPESQHVEPELMYYPDKCIGCGKCVKVCSQGAITEEEGMILFDKSKCVNCGTCAGTCYAASRKMAGELMSVSEVIKEADKDMTFYRSSGGGITFSGGEAMIYPEFVCEVMKHYKEVGVNTAIETCGYVEWDAYEKVAEYLDLALFDVKMIDDEKHIKYCGGSNQKILHNLTELSKRVETVVRMPMIPGINDSKEDIRKVGEFLKSLEGRIKEVHILAYHNFGVNKYHALGRSYLLDDIKAPSDEHMDEIKKQLEGYGYEVIIGG